MKAASYAYGIGSGRAPVEYLLLQNIDRFGVRAVLGRDLLYYHEIARMRYSESVIRACYERNRSENWAQWTNSNKELAKLLSEAEETYYGRTN